MKAIVIEEFGPVGTARCQQVELPEPAPGEVQVRIRAVAANFVDTLVMTGKYQFLPERPFIPGKLPVGEVSKVGDGVSGFKPGDRVLTTAEHGGYADYVCVPEDACTLLPGGLGFDDAASMALAYDTSWVSLFERGRLKPGETVLVLGATGAVGLATVQLAKAKGAKVLAGVSSMAKAGPVQDAGADHIIDLSVANLRDGLRDQVLAANAGVGADVVIDPLGGDYFDAALRAMAWRGRLVVVGFAAGRIPEVKVNYLMLKNIEVSGIQVSDYRKRMPALMRECFSEIFALHAQGKLQPAPATIFPLEDYARAFADMAERRLAGRAILHP